MKSISSRLSTEYDAECIARKTCYEFSILERRCWHCLYPKGVVSEGQGTYRRAVDILLLGAGGREHAAAKLQESPQRRGEAPRCSRRGGMAAQAEIALLLK